MKKYKKYFLIQSDYLRSIGKPTFFVQLNYGKEIKNNRVVDHKLLTTKQNGSIPGKASNSPQVTNSFHPTSSKETAKITTPIIKNEGGKPENPTGRPPSPQKASLNSTDGSQNDEPDLLSFGNASEQQNVSNEPSFLNDQNMSDVSFGQTNQEDPMEISNSENAVSKEELLKLLPEYENRMQDLKERINTIMETNAAQVLDLQTKNKNLESQNDIIKQNFENNIKTMQSLNEDNIDNLKKQYQTQITEMTNEFHNKIMSQENEHGKELSEMRKFMKDKTGQESTEETINRFVKSFDKKAPVVNISTRQDKSNNSLDNSNLDVTVISRDKSNDAVTLPLSGAESIVNMPSRSNTDLTPRTHVDETTLQETQTPASVNSIANKTPSLQESQITMPLSGADSIANLPSVSNASLTPRTHVSDTTLQETVTLPLSGATSIANLPSNANLTPRTHVSDTTLQETVTLPLSGATSIANLPSNSNINLTPRTHVSETTLQNTTNRTPLIRPAKFVNPTPDIRDMTTKQVVTQTPSLQDMSTRPVIETPLLRTPRLIVGNNEAAELDDTVFLPGNVPQSTQIDQTIDIDRTNKLRSSSTPKPTKTTLMRNLENLNESVIPFLTETKTVSPREEKEKLMNDSFSQLDRLARLEIINQNDRNKALRQNAAEIGSKRRAHDITHLDNIDENTAKVRAVQPNVDKTTGQSLPVKTKRWIEEGPKRKAKSPYKKDRAQSAREIKMRKDNMKRLEAYNERRASLQSNS